MYLSPSPEMVSDLRARLNSHCEPTLHLVSQVAAVDGEALRLKVRATSAVRDGAQRALAKQYRRGGAPASLDELTLAHANAKQRADDALRSYARYLSEAPDLMLHLRPR